MVIHTISVVAGLKSSVLVLSGELRDMELTDEGDCVEQFPKMETFPNSFCSSDSLSGSCIVASFELDLVQSLFFIFCTSLAITQSTEHVLAALSTLMCFPEWLALSLL